MSYVRRVNWSNSRELRHSQTLKCEDALAENRKIIKEKIRKVKKIQNYSDTADFRKYGLYPGQQIEDLPADLSRMQQFIYTMVS